MKLYLFPIFFLFASLFAINVFATENLNYETRGIGGGGATSGFSMSPYKSLWFIGTDMGTLFRSENKGASWESISHSQTRFSADLNNAASIGFSSDRQTVFHAYGGCYPQRSFDGGKTWHYMDGFLAMLTGGDYYNCWNSENKSRVRYWIGHSFDENLIFAGGASGFFRTENKGNTWQQIEGLNKKSIGTVIDYSTTPSTIYHGTVDGIYVSLDSGKTFKPFHIAKMHSFTGGFDNAGGLTLAFIENNAAACSSAGISTSNEHCGYIWVKRGAENFVKLNQFAGDFIKMAENNSQVIYTTGSNHWNKEPGIGTSVWVSKDAGATWNQKFQQYVDREPWYSWNPDLFEMSGVAYDVGLHDDGYHSFSVNRRNSIEAGGTENYFLHVTDNFGETWKSPITKFADIGKRGKGKAWQSIGLEVTSVHSVKFHPTNSQIVYAGYSDIGGLVSEDGGKSWRITRIMNSIYDHAFDPANDNVVFAGTSTFHDWPHGGYRNIALNKSSGEMNYNGGIYKSSDRGREWQRLTPDNRVWNVPFLAVAYDEKNNIIYGGTQGRGLARSIDGGNTWQWFNNGLGNGAKIIGQIELDPKNSDVYIMLSGDAPEYKNIDKTGIYRLKYGADNWEHLRGVVHEPYELETGTWENALWNYPVHFAIDWKDSARKTMWLTDVRIPTQYLAEGLWKTTDGGQNWYQKYIMPDPAKITIHPDNSDVVYLSGMVDAPDFDKVDSGAVYTEDGGVTWKKNFGFSAHHIVSDMAIDPSDSSKVLYGTFGAGMFYGDNPVLVNATVPEVSPEPLPIPVPSSAPELKDLVTYENLSGILIKGPEKAAVYLLRDNKRYVFPNEKIYYSWFQDFSNVKNVSADELASYQLGGNITFKPGTPIKLSSDPKVYLVVKGGDMRWIRSAAVAKRLFGEGWKYKVKDLYDSLFVDYRIGEVIY